MNVNQEVAQDFGFENFKIEDRSKKIIALRSKREEEEEAAKRPNRAPYFVNRERMPRMVVKVEENRVNLKCKAGGEPEPNITWYKNDQPPKRLLGGIYPQHWSLVLEDINTNDIGEYKCVICNELGCINHTYTVIVIRRLPNKPVLIHPVENKTVTVGSSTKLSCEFDRAPFVLWKRIFPDKDPLVVKRSGEADDREVLHIQNVTYQDEGWYVCIAGNSVGLTAAKAYLSVVESIYEEPKNKSKEARSRCTERNGCPWLYR